MWCDTVGHTRRECTDFAEALKSNVVNLWNGQVHACETRKPLELNISGGGMERLMEEVVARHAEAIHYSASVGIRFRIDDDLKP